MSRATTSADVLQILGAQSVEDLCQQYWSHHTDMESAPARPDKRRHRKLRDQVREELVRRLDDRTDDVLESHAAGYPYCDCAESAAPATEEQPPLRARRPRVMYVEQKTDGARNLNGQGPAWIGQVTFSKSGRTVYVNGKTFHRSKRTYGGNYRCVEDGDEYWISGVKKRLATNRRPARDRFQSSICKSRDEGKEMY